MPVRRGLVACKNGGMSEGSQIVVPPSFIALYLKPGRTRPQALLAEIAARHEFCEDLAQALTERAQALKWESGVTEADVLQRIERGLQAPDAGVTPGEAGWVMGRLAEVLQWPAWQPLRQPGSPA